MNDTSPHLGALLSGDCVDVVVVVTFTVCSNLQQTPTFLVFGSRQIVGKYLQKVIRVSLKILEECRLQGVRKLAVNANVSG